jgi:HPt (histidine-containing phosphotransfer) domain-containing protein
MDCEETLLDVELLDEDAQINLDGLRELIDIYLKAADEILKDLRAATEVGAADDVQRLAHKLAGSSAVCGVKAMIQPLRALEQRGRKGQLSDADQLLAQTVQRLEMCRRLLAEYLAKKGGEL